MNKPPAFQFYPKDFLSDINVSIMNMEERGVYITLLSHCWLEGWLPNASTKLKRLCNNPPNWKELWENIKHCFYENGNKLYHKRLEEERAKQLEWREKSKKGGIKSGESRRGKPEKTKGGSTKAKPKGNSSSSSSSSFPSSNVSSVKNKDIDFQLTDLLIKRMKDNDPKSKTPEKGDNQYLKWVNNIRLCREQDKRSAEEIQVGIEYSQEDDFWKGNVLSTDKLRKQLPKLLIQSKNKKGLTRDEKRKKGLEDWAKEKPGEEGS